MKKLFMRLIPFVLAIILIFAATVHIALFLSKTFKSWKTYEVAVPATSDIYLEEGRYQILYEFDSNQSKLDIGSQNFKEELKLIMQNNEVIAIVTNINEQKDVNLVQDRTVEYTRYKVLGKSLYKFNINKEGYYRVTTDFQNEEQTEGVIVKVTESYYVGILNVIKVVLIWVVFILALIIWGILINTIWRKKSIPSM